MHYKWLIVITLYLIGGIIFFFYKVDRALKDERFGKIYGDLLRQGYSDRTASTLVTIAVIGLCLLWPYLIIDLLTRKENQRKED